MWILHFRKRLGAGLFGGEGFILQKLSGPGQAFVNFDGEIIERNLAAGETLRVDTGHVAMFETTVDFDVEMVRGFKNILLGGEGLFLGTLRLRAFGCNGRHEQACPEDRSIYAAGWRAGAEWRLEYQSGAAIGW